jgi:uncharacterized membrane protein YgcG
MRKKSRLNCKKIWKIWENTNLSSETIWKIWKLNESDDIIQYPEQQQKLTEGYTPEQQQQRKLQQPSQRGGGGGGGGGGASGGGGESGGGGGFAIDFFPISGEPLNFDSVISVKVLGI